MEWNFLIWAGFILRILKYILDDSYPYNWKIPEGKANIKKSIWSFFVVGLIYFLAFYYHADDKYQDGWQLVMVWGLYITLGWAIDSIFLAFVNFMQQKILARFSKNTNNVPEPKP